jgi:hypothetical protein
LIDIMESLKVFNRLCYLLNILLLTFIVLLIKKRIVNKSNY